MDVNKEGQSTMDVTSKLPNLPLCSDLPSNITECQSVNLDDMKQVESKIIDYGNREKDNEVDNDIDNKKEEHTKQDLEIDNHPIMLIAKYKSST
jgi:hypothetical protein